MLLRSSPCKSLESRRVGQSWEGEKSWDELRKRWYELSGGEKSWEELRRGGQRWVVEKSWQEQGRGEKSWAEVGRDGTTLIRRAEMVWEELGSDGHNWKGVTQNDDEFAEQSWEAVRVCCISYRQTLSLDPIASQFLDLETSATCLARVLLVYVRQINMSSSILSLCLQASMLLLQCTWQNWNWVWPRKITRYGIYV